MNKEEQKKIHEKVGKILCKTRAFPLATDMAVSMALGQMVDFIDSMVEEEPVSDLYEKFVSDVANAIPKREIGWKPSVEKLKVMKEAVMYFGDSWVSRKHQVLRSLYEDLLKL